MYFNFKDDYYQQKSVRMFKLTSYLSRKNELIIKNVIQHIDNTKKNEEITFKINLSLTNIYFFCSLKNLMK